jgi:hypothetical protein
MRRRSKQLEGLCSGKSRDIQGGSGEPERDLALRLASSELILGKLLEVVIHLFSLATSSVVLAVETFT